MNSIEAKKLFAQALDEKLSGALLAEFEAALIADEKLRAEFESYSDLRGGNLANIHSWLVQSGEASRKSATVVDSRITDEMIERVRAGRSRGRVIQIVFAGAALAAAAAIVAVLMLPVATEPNNASRAILNFGVSQSGTSSLPDNFRYASRPVSMSEEGTSIEFSPGSIFKASQAVDQGSSARIELLEGQLNAKLGCGEDRIRVIILGASELWAKGPNTEFKVLAQATTSPDQYEESLVSFDNKFRPRRLARFGAATLTLTVTVIAGSVELHAAQGVSTLKPGAGFGPQVIQTQPQPPQPGRGPKPEPPKAEDVFEHLDENKDGKLDEDEFGDPGHTDFDDDKDGKVSFAEFKAHFKPPHPPTPEEAFKRQDKNDDGKLDAQEIDQKIIDEMDDDKNGSINLDEFRKHFKPRGPKPEDEFARLDKNSDGKLDNTETHQPMIDEFDDNKDGKVDLDEFKAHFKPPHPGQKPEDVFKQFDKNNDGKLDDQEAEQPMIDKFDDNNDGKIDLDEFRKHFKPQGPRAPEDMFKQLDKNNDGKLDDVELADKDMFDYLDKNTDKKVDLDEWKEGHKPENMFKFLDKNNDGKLDDTELDEFRLKAMDANKDGKVDLEEFKKPPKPRGPGGPGGPGEGPGPGRGEGPGPGRPPRGPGGPPPR